MPDRHTLTAAGHPIRIRRHASARRLTLRIGANGPVLTLPRRTALRDAQAFLDQHRDWLADKLAAVPRRARVDFGTELPFAGETLTVTRAETGRPRVTGGALLVADSDPARAVRGFLIAQARRDLTAASTEHAASLGVSFGSITLRDTRSRWGSCTAAGNLNYSWRLIMAPAEVLDYVAAHEVAHLVQMNHSRRYWDTVARICPDYAVYRDWLRANGPDLHRHDFGS